MPARRELSPDDVFINCPFDDGYRPTFEALIFAIFACGFRPRSALEIDDGGQARIEKLIAIIAQCRFGIHDISRTQLDPDTHLPRFNMPLELGLFLGAKRYGSPAQRQKMLLILDVEKFRYQRFISDLAGMDIHEHGGIADRALRQCRDWLANVSRRRLPGAELISNSYERFREDLPALAAPFGFHDDIPYVDYEHLVTAWLTAAA